MYVSLPRENTMRLLLFVPRMMGHSHSSCSIIIGSRSRSCSSSIRSRCVARKIASATAGRVRSTPGGTTLSLQQQEQQQERQQQNRSISSPSLVCHEPTTTKRPDDSKSLATATATAVSVSVSARDVKPFLSQINNRIDSLHQILLRQQQHDNNNNHNTDFFPDPTKDDTATATATSMGEEDAWGQPAQEILADLKKFLEENNNNGKEAMMIRKYRPELSVLLERLLHLYSQMAVHAAAAAVAAPTTTTTITAAQWYQECLAVFKVLDSWNLDKQHAHYQAAILAASAAQQWSEAAEWFWNQIDPDAGGYVPLTIDSLQCIEPSDSTTSRRRSSNIQQQLLVLQQPPVVVGLVAIAKAAQERMKQSSSSSSSTTPQNHDPTWSEPSSSSPPCGMPVVDAVMDAVLRMTMVSPNDREKHVLAAGAAIGLVGEWEAFVEYRSVSYNALELGQPLIAAVMYACVLCGRYDEALQVFREVRCEGDNAIAEEWQWAGGQDKIHPLCKDLAMRVLGSAGEFASSFSNATLAVELLNEAKAEGTPISVDALCGIVEALGSEGSWDVAMDLFNFVVNTSSKPSLLTVSGGDLDQFLSEHVAPPSSEPITQSTTKSFAHLVPLLDSVMRACNANGRHGTSLLALRLFQVSSSSSPMVDLRHFMKQRSNSILVESIAPTIINLSGQKRKELLTSTMVSLCGVSCPDTAVELYESVQSLVPEGALADEPNDLYEFCQSESPYVHSDSIYVNNWEAVARNVHRFTAVFQSLKHERPDGVELGAADRNLLSSALAICVRACTTVGHPSAGLHLVKWTEEVPRFPGEAGESVCLGNRNICPVTDSLLAAMMQAHASMGRHDLALALYDTFVRLDGCATLRTRSVSSAIESLFASDRYEEGLTLFQDVVVDARSPRLFAAAARGLASAGKWNEVADLYRFALSSGCLSEDLSLLALRATKDSGVRIMRNIIHECAQLMGVSGSVWTEQNYWKLLKLIRFPKTSRLLWWDDPTTSQLDELELALHHLETRASTGLTPKFAALRCIVDGAQRFQANYIPADRTGLPRVPRDPEAWLRTLRRVLDEAETTPLICDPDFVSQVIFALHNLGYLDEMIKFMNESLSRGVRVRQATLAMAFEACKEIGADAPPDILMMSDCDIEE